MTVVKGCMCKSNLDKANNLYLAPQIIPVCPTEVEPPKGHGEMWQWYLSGSSLGCFAPLTRNQSPRRAMRTALSEYDKRRAHGTVCVHASAFVSEPHELERWVPAASLGSDHEL